MKRERVIETVVKTVALRTVVDVAVDQDMVGSVVTKVSLNSEFTSRKKYDEKNCS